MFGAGDTLPDTDRRGADHLGSAARRPLVSRPSLLMVDTVTGDEATSCRLEACC